MAAIKTEAIVLKTIKFSESSLIVTILTKEHGKIAVIAKGARKPKSRFTGMLSPGQILHVVYYLKTTRNVQTLAESDYAKKLMSIRTDITKMALCSSVLELAGSLVHENEKNLAMFKFLNRFLPWLETYHEELRLIFPYVQLRLAEISGIGIQSEASEAKKAYLNIENGSVSEMPAQENAILLTSNQFIFITDALKRKNSSILQFQLTNTEIKDLVHYLDKYFRYHIEGMKERKSDRIFDQLLNH